MDFASSKPRVSVADLAAPVVRLDWVGREEAARLAGSPPRTTLRKVPDLSRGSHPSGVCGRALRSFGEVSPIYGPVGRTKRSSTVGVQDRGVYLDSRTCGGRVDSLVEPLAGGQTTGSIASPPKEGVSKTS